MPQPPPPTAGPRLSSFAGLRDAGILESVSFDPFTGVVAVHYTARYMCVLRSLDLLLLDPGFLGALLIDDPTAMRMFIDRTVATLEGGTPAPDSQAGQES